MLSAKLQYYLGSFKQKGAFETIKQTLYDYYYKRKLAKYNFLFQPPDLPLTENLKASEEVLNRSKGKDGVLDSATSSYYVFKYFRKLKLNPKNVTLLDVGCGGGKILSIGIMHGFNRVIGIDLDTKSLERAVDNCKKAEKIHPGTKFELVNADAGSYVIPENVNVVFLANPFYETTMSMVIANIERSYNTSKRSIYVIYHCPNCAYLFDWNPLFKKFYTGTFKAGGPEVIIYQTVNK